jgi:acyl-CoA thioesterase FadM
VETIVVRHAPRLETVPLRRLPATAAAGGGIFDACQQNKAPHGRMSLVVGAATVRFRKELKAFRAFTIRTRLVGWDSRSLFFEQAFVSYKDSIGGATSPSQRSKLPQGKASRETEKAAAKAAMGRAESVAGTIARRAEATGDVTETAAPDVILHAVVVSRLFFINKATTRALFERMGLGEAETPIPLPPPPDVASWAVAAQGNNERVKRDSRLLGSRL